MKIEYKGRNPEEDRCNREAWILYNEDNMNEAEKAIKVIGLLECMGWKTFHEEGWAIVRVTDKDEYDILVSDYKKAKTMV